MKVQVYHLDFGRPPAVLVAEVSTLEVCGHEEALDWAWRHTQNIDGSWSRGEYIEGYDGQRVRNRDYVPWVRVLAPLPTFDGRTYGLRSSMVGDVFVIGTEAFKAAKFGFEPTEMPLAEPPK